MAKAKKGSKAYFNGEIKVFEKTLNECVNNPNKSRTEKQACVDGFASSAKNAFDRLKNNRRYAGVAAALDQKVIAAAAEYGTEAPGVLTTTQTEQNFILQNIDKFISFKGRPTPESLDKVILVKGGQGNLINTLTSSRKLGPLFKATSLELSMLVPYIRLYKVSTKDGQIIEQEFRFEGHLNATDLLKDKNSFGAGVGFKSFSWNTTGTNPYTAPRTLMATLTLYFQTIVDMNRSAGSFSEDTENPLPAPPKWYDLFIQQGTKRATAAPVCSPSTGVGDVLESAGNVDDAADSGEIARNRNKPEDAAPIDNFKIMATIGWAHAKDSAGILSDGFKEAIDKSRITFILGYYNHDINFREDGSVEITVSYTARMDGEMGGYSANLFDLDENGKDCGVYEEITKLENQIKNVEYNLSGPGGAVPCAEQQIERDNPFISDAQRERLFRQVDKGAEEIKKQISKLQEGLEGEKRRLKTSIYGKFLQHIIENKKLYGVTGNEADYRSGDFKSFKSPLLSDNAGFASQNAALFGGNVAENAVELATEVDPDDREESFVNASKLAQGIGSYVNDVLPIPEGKIRINFFYFGDLINFYAGALPQESGGAGNEKKKYEIILGNLTFLDQKKKEALSLEIYDIMASSPEGVDLSDEELEKRVAEQVESFTSSATDYSTYIKSESLAHMPISLDLYTKWFADAVINGDTVFTFKRFLELIVSQLLVGALEPHIPGAISDLSRNLREKNRTRVAIIGGTNDYLKPGKMLDIGAEARDDRTGENKALITNYEIGENFKEFLVLSATRLPNSGRVINESKNKEQGIYHLRIGADKGIVKSISFNRETNAAMQTSNIMKAYNKGGGGLGILRLPYQATVRIVGNSFFQPGQYIYIDPTSVGPLDRAARLHVARDLIGLGGFYLIIKASSTMQSGLFETTLDCKWETYGTLPTKYKTPGEALQEITDQLVPPPSGGNQNPSPNIEEPAGQS